MVKQNIIVILILVSLLGCSAKNSASKNGAILGTTAGAMAGGVMGLALSATKSEKDDFTKNAIIGAVIVGAIGYMTGSAMGYVVDTAGNKETKEIEKMAKSHKIVKKSLKQKPLATPEAINNAQIANEVSSENSMLDVNTEPRRVEKITPSQAIASPETINDVQITNEVSNAITQEMSVVEISSGTVTPIEPTEIQSDSEEITVDTQENKALW